jgi:diguanylate cyclase
MHCLIMLDIDHFKKFYDTQGQVMGGRVIQALCELLRASVHDKSHSVARYGSEEFAALLRNTTLDFSAKLADTVRTRTCAMKPGDEAHRFIARADGVLYQSKNAGRDRVNCA